MSSLVLASVPIHGHVAPLLPLARALVSRGDRVRFLTGSRFADAVRATGAEYIALPEDADFDDRTVTSLFLERESLSAVNAIAFDFEHIFVRPGEHQLAALRELIAGEPTDAVVCDPLFMGAAFLVEAPPADRVPVIVAGLVPLNFPSPGLAPFGMGLPPLGGLAGAIRNGVLSRVAGRLFRPVDSAAAEIAERANGRALRGPVLDWLPRADAVCQLTVASFEYSRPDAPASLVFIGPLTESAATEHPLPEWWSDLDGSRPVVHVTQGTIANDDLGELVAPTLAALAEEDVLVIVSTGGTPVADLGPLPENARAAEFLPYDALLPRTDLFVTNGGYGGVQFALRHGVPIVVAPGKEDKGEVAARIAWSHTGINLRTQRPTPRALSRAVRSVLEDRRYRDAAARIGADIAASAGVVGFLDTVDREIARAASEDPASVGLRRG